MADMCTCLPGLHPAFLAHTLKPSSGTKNVWGSLVSFAALLFILGSEMGLEFELEERYGM